MADDDWTNLQLGMAGMGLALAGYGLWYARRLLLGPAAGAAPVIAPVAPVMPALAVVPVAIPVIPVPVVPVVVGGPPAAPPAPPMLHAVPPPPPVVGGGGGYVGVADELANSPAIRALRGSARLRGLERDVGHLFARHGPDVTDGELTARLTTGLDREGLPAPCPGVSTRFRSRQRLVDTFEDVLGRIGAAMVRTRNALTPNIQTLAAAEAAVAPGHGLIGAAIAAAFQVRTDARADLLAAINATGGVGAVGAAPMMPVHYCNVHNRIELYETYAFIRYHANIVGEGFYGTHPAPNTPVAGIAPKGVGRNATLTVYGVTNAYLAPLNETLTVISVPLTERAFGAAHNVLNWTLITHYPTGQIAGGAPLIAGFSAYNGING